MYKNCERELNNIIISIEASFIVLDIDFPASLKHKIMVKIKNFKVYNNAHIILKIGVITQRLSPVPC